MVCSAVIEVIFSTESATVTDDVGTVDVCVEVSNEQVDEGVRFRIPIAAETVEGTAGMPVKRVCVCVGGGVHYSSLGTQAFLDI